MTREEMIKEAVKLRSRDRFGLMTADEVAAIPGSQRTLDIPMPDGHAVRVYEITPDRILSNLSPLIINYHGGGFIKGRTDRDHRYCSHLAEKLNCVIWDVDYILAPEAPYPAAAEESYHTACYAYSHAEQLGIDRAKIALAGHSAGGNLVASVCIRLGQTKIFRPCAALMEYFPANNGSTILQRYAPEQLMDPRQARRAETEQLYQEFYCTQEEGQDPLCSPIFAETEQLAGFPESLIISAEQDSLRGETEAFAVKLAQANITVTLRRIHGAMHGFTTNRTNGWEEALDLHCKFFQTHF